MELAGGGFVKISVSRERADPATQIEHRAMGRWLVGVAWHRMGAVRFVKRHQENHSLGVNFNKVGDIDQVRQKQKKFHPRLDEGPLGR